jgi:multiple sugar transport system substrate-binding protein
MLIALGLASIVALVPLPSVAPVGSTIDMATWGMPFEDRLFEDIYARGFEAANPGVRVRYNRYEQNITDKYLAWHVLGRGADVMRVRITDYHSFVERGMLLPIDSFLDDPAFGLPPAAQADLLPAVWDLLEIDGHRYALPTDNAQYGLYYNRAIFDRFNAAHPLDPVAYPDASWTWDDLRDAARRLTIPGEGGAFVQYGIDFDLWAWPFMALLRQAGGRLWDDQQTTTLIDSPAGEEALALIVELIPHTASMRTVSTVGSISGPDKLFAGGQAAMILDGSWRAPDLERVNPDLDFAIAPLPRHRERAVVSGSVLWAISAHSEHPLLAWRMIRWMSTDDQAFAYWDTLRVAPPPVLSIIRSERFRETRGLIGPDGTVHVHPMPRSRYVDRAAWLEDAVTPDPETGVAPGFVPVAPHQKDLEDAIEAMLKHAVAPGRTQPLADLLEDAATHVHQIIDRDRAARGLPPVERQ